jgi:hypothetical protein
MSRSIYLVGLVHNTAAFPYQLSREIQHWALASGKFDAVKCFSFREAVHTTLLPLIGQQAGTFDSACLALQMPWANSVKPMNDEHGNPKPETEKQRKDRVNSTKYATACIEFAESMEIGLSEHFFQFYFPREVVRQLKDSPDAKRILLVVTDIRTQKDIVCIKQSALFKKHILVRVQCADHARKEIKCAALDSSRWETFSSDVPVGDIAMSLDDTATEDELEILNAKIGSLLLSLEEEVGSLSTSTASSPKTPLLNLPE